MAQTVSLTIPPDDRLRLAAIVADRSRPLKYIQRAQIVLLSAPRLPVLEVARLLALSRPAVWRWQRRYPEEGVEGLLRDKTWRPGKAPVPLSTVAKVVAMTCGDPPREVAHWTGRAMAKATGLSLTTIQRIWKAHKLAPHRLRTFKKSNDPKFAEKVEDIVGLYMNPPANAIILSIDEKSQIQALDRTQPGPPLKPGKAGTMTHDYHRNGTTTLFAALYVLSGAAVGRCMQKHTHQRLIKLLNAVDKEIPEGKIVHAVLDNYATHKQRKVRARLERHPHWVFHFTPTSGSWLNAVENFFSVLTRRRIRRGVFKSVVDLQAAINRYLKEHNQEPKPFVWTKPASEIMAKLDRLVVPSV